MRVINLNEIPKMMADGVIGEDDAVKEIAEHIYCFPNKFGISKFDEDFRSEIILRFLQIGKAMFDSYDKKYDNFIGYVFVVVRGIVMALLRKRKDDLLSAKIASREESHLSVYDTTKYTPEISVADNTPAYSAQIDTEKPKHFIFHELKDFSKIRPPRKVNKTVKENAIMKTALVLALKSSYFMSDNHISRVSDYCGVDKNSLEKLLSKVKKTMYGRVHTFEKLQMQRDNSYYYHRKYAAMIDAMTKDAGNDEKKLEKLEKQYEKQTASWKNRNDRLQKIGYHVSPTNRAVAHELGVCERQVSYYITLAKKYVENKAAAEKEQ